MKIRYTKIKYYAIVRHYDICETQPKTMKKLFSIMSNLQTNYHFKLDLKKWTNIQEAIGYFAVPNTSMTMSCKAWNSPVEYSCRESKYDLLDWLVFRRARPTHLKLATFWILSSSTGIILGLDSAIERRRHIVTPALIGWANTQNKRYSIIVLRVIS